MGRPGAWTHRDQPSDRVCVGRPATRPAQEPGFAGSHLDPGFLRTDWGHRNCPGPQELTGAANARSFVSWEPAGVTAAS